LSKLIYSVVTKAVISFEIEAIGTLFSEFFQEKQNYFLNQRSNNY